jgi:hypothetical protein
VAQKNHTCEAAETIKDCISRIRQSGAFDRSQTCARLLDYLADRAILGETPKEFDISVDVFGKNQAGLEAGDSQTRVHVYKLRSRLDAYYAGPGKHDPFRLEIPKGTYRLAAVAHQPREQIVTRRYGVLIAAGALLLASVVLNVALLLGPSKDSGGRELLDNSAWSGLIGSKRPVLVVVGDHFFFGERGGSVRTRDIAINSKKELLASAYGSNPDVKLDDTLSYLPKSAVFGLQAILPRALATGQAVNIKLVSELTSDDLRDHDVIYVGFVRAMGFLREYYFGKSNFCSEPPLFMTLTHIAHGDAYVRTGPVPERNTDYGLFARFLGPSGNQILVFTGIGDVGVLAAVDSLSRSDGIGQVEQLLRSAEMDLSSGFEVLIEADGHSRTDLGFRVVGAYRLSAQNHDLACMSPQTTSWTAASPPPEIPASR